MLFSRREVVLSLACWGLASVASVAFTIPSLAEPPSGRRVALSGYDPVAYFVDGGPAKGSPEFWYSFDDVVYTFRSAEHRALFAADPERYAPQYNGYCAGGVSKGYKAEPDPDAWIIANGKLYVFEFKDRVPFFRTSIDDVSGLADANWPTVKLQ